MLVYFDLVWKETYLFEVCQTFPDKHWLFLENSNPITDRLAYMEDANNFKTFLKRISLHDIAGEMFVPIMFDLDIAKLSPSYSCGIKCAAVALASKLQM